MNWRDIISRIFTAALLVVLLSLSLVPILSPSEVLAAGSQKFEMRTGQKPELIRTNQSTIIVTSWMKITETGISSETFALFKLRQTLTLQPDSDSVDDEWKVTKIEMYDLQNESTYGSNGSTITSPQLAFFRNRDNELIASVDYTRLPTELVTNNDGEESVYTLPCYRVYTDPKFGANDEAIPITAGAAGCEKGSYPGTQASPAGAVASSINAAGNLDPSDDRFPSVQNYDLSNGNVDVNFTRDKITNWFSGQNIGSVEIKRFEEAGKPPYIDVPANANLDRPKLRFVLAHIGAEGSGWVLWKNIDWFVFQAYLLNSDNTQGNSVSNLYIALNDGLGVNILYDENSVGVGKGQFTELTDSIQLSETNANRFFGYAYYHVPKDPLEENCGKEDVYTVGPTGSGYRHYDEITGRPDPARQLNGNCIVPGAGWPQYWGISVNSVPFEKSKCELSELVAIGSIGDSFSKALECLFTDVFSAITGRAQEWVTDAAGQDLAGYIADPDGFVFRIWKVSRSIINILLIIALLAISFSNILHGSFGINLDSYTVKKALPKLFLGIILANASFLMVRFIVDIGNVITNYFAVDLAGQGGFGNLVGFATKSIAIESIETIGTGLGILAPLIAVVAAIVSFVLLVWLAFLLYLRLVAVYLLVILAPVTFVAFGLPGLGGFFGQWWQQFTKWVFLVPAMAVVFWLMAEIGKVSENSIAQLLIMYILFIVALTLPSKWGGSFINKASEGFAKYTGINAAREGVKKWAGDTAKLAGESVLTKTPGLRSIARYQEWSKKNKENWEKSNKLSRERLAEKAMSGKGRFSTGRRAGRLSLIEQELKDSTARITADNIKAAAEADPRLLNRLAIAELQKTASEKRLEEAKKLHRLNFLKKAQIGPDDMDQVKAGERRFVAEIAKVLEEFADATADEQIISGEVTREEGIINGNKMNQLYQVPQALDNYKKHRIETIRAYQEYKKAKGTPEEDATKAKFQAAKASRDSVEAAFDALKVQDKHRYVGGQDLSQLSVKQASMLLDEETAGKLLNNKELGGQISRLVSGQLRQGYRAFSAGVLAQIKDEVKEQTIPEIQDELREFLDKDLAKAANGDASLLKSLQQAFFRGDTASLAAAGIPLHKIRGGLVVAEKYKTVLKSTNDVRHSQAMESWMNQANAVLDDNEKFTDQEIVWGTSTDTKDRRAMAGDVLRFGPMARGVGKRQEYGGDRARQQNNAVKPQGGGRGGNRRVSNTAQTGGGDGNGDQSRQFTPEDVEYARDFLGGGIGEPPDVSDRTKGSDDEEEEMLEGVEEEIDGEES